MWGAFVYGTKESVRITKEFNCHKISLVHQHDRPPFHCFGCVILEDFVCVQKNLSQLFLEIERNPKQNPKLAKFIKYQRVIK